jgi:hypothetical protein
MHAHDRARNDELKIPPTKLRIPMPAPTMIDNCFTIFPNFKVPALTPYASR